MFHLAGAFIFFFFNLTKLAAYTYFSHLSSQSMVLPNITHPSFFNSLVTGEKKTHTQISCLSVLSFAPTISLTSDKHYEVQI